MTNYLSAQQNKFLSELPQYIENLEVFESGQEPPRAYHIPDDHLSLNGSWKFLYSDTPEGIPKNFFNPQFDDNQWSSINVPSNWEMEGYSDPLFRNISTTYTIGKPGDAPPDPYTGIQPPKLLREFAVIPPDVPDEYNPTGAYRTVFSLPEGWADKEIFLRFEKIASASFVWVNGQEVGYNEGAQEPSEYDITSYLQEGENTIAVLVIKFSDGYYLEGQDYWRLAGIFDDVWVFATPKVRLFDWQVVTDLDDNYRHAELSVDINVKSYDTRGYQYTVKTILEKEGKVVTTLGSESFDINRYSDEVIPVATNIMDPEKWTAITPHLYRLTIQLIDAEGHIVDEVKTRIGFKETAIIGNTFYLNGIPVKLHSINSHMQHPKYGHTMDEFTIRKDFEILKQFNFNSVRTSHYPPVNKYLELADEYGLYIIDEAGTEAHASEYMSDMPAYIPMYLDRVRKMVIRDRNHPSILFWSAGNESGEGENITKVIEEGKRLDPTRYWMYGGNADKHPGEEIIGPRYPTPMELEVIYGMDTADLRPSFMDEYLSIAGNGGGGLDEFWQVIYQYPRLMAGAIWDFVSPGLTSPVRALQDQSPYNTTSHIMGRAKLVGGQTGKVLDLNGHDQWVEIYRAEHLEVTSDELTLSMDIYPRKLNRSSGSLITKGNYQFGLEQRGQDSIDFYIYTDRKYILRGALPGEWENNWHQLNAIYNGAEMKIFIDGNEVGHRSVIGMIHNFPQPLNIGRNAELHGQDMDVYLCDAQLDNVAIYNKAILPNTPFNPEDALLFLDFEEEVNEGDFYSIGIGARTYGAVWPDRTPQPEMWQMKKTVQPLSFSMIDLESGMVEVWNRSNFANADHWNTSWTLTKDDEVIQSGDLLLKVPPQSRTITSIDFQKPNIVPGKEYRLNITSTLKTDELWASKGFEVSWDQFELTEWNVPLEDSGISYGTVSINDQPEKIEVIGSGFKYTIDKSLGALSAMQVKGEELLTSPLRFNVWRAPIANELDTWNGGTMRTKRWKEGLGSTISTDYYSSGIHDLKFYPIDISTEQIAGEVIIYVRQLALTNGGKKDYTVLDRYVKGLTLSGFESKYEYHISADGNITIKHQVDPQGTMPQLLPRIGLTLGLEDNYDQIEWYGRGPQENYPDRKTGYRLGIFQSDVESMHEPYLIPQDNGLRTDNRWVRVTNAIGHGLEFRMDEYFNFNVSPYTIENLTRSLYTYQLTRGEGITLNLDYATTGVGGTARPVLEPYRVYPQRYERELIIRPLHE